MEGYKMSQENKNRNKDKGKQNNKNKFNHQEKMREMEIAEDTEFLNLDGKKNKRHNR